MSKTALDSTLPVLFRMENTVLGNALEGVPEESSEEGEKQNDSKIESADNLDGWYSAPSNIDHRHGL